MIKLFGFATIVSTVAAVQIQSIEFEQNPGDITVDFENETLTTMA